MGNVQGGGQSRMFAKPVKWLDAQELAKQDPKSYFAPNQEHLQSLIPGDYVKLISLAASERYWAEVLGRPEGESISVIIRSKLSASDSISRHIDFDTKMAIPLKNICDIRKKMRRHSLHVSSKKKAKDMASNIVRETGWMHSLSLGAAMSGELSSTTIYKTAEMLYKQGKINQEQFNILIENPDSYSDAVTAMKEVVSRYERNNGTISTTSSATSANNPKKDKSKSKKKKPSKSPTKSNKDSKTRKVDNFTSLEGTIAEMKRNYSILENYKKTVLENVVDMFIRFEKRKPTNIELADLTLEVSETVIYDKNLFQQAIHDDEFTELIEKLSAPVNSHDRAEQRLHEWLIEEARDLQLHFRTDSHFSKLQVHQENDIIEMIGDDVAVENDGSKPEVQQGSPLKMKRERTNNEQLVLVV